MAYRFRGMVTWCTLLIAVFELSICQTGWSDDSEDLVSTAQVEAVVGKVASLPCNIEPDSNEDRVYMVLWFRHAGGKPLYSFDVRGRSFNKALHWSDPLAFGPRAHFRTIAKPSSLTIDAVQLDDEGMYRCRVDFKNSPTRNFQIRLNVVVPPHQVLLYDEAGKDVAGVVGPLEEGENFTLLCELRGGRPQPTLKWLINKTPLEDHVILKNDGKVIISRITVTGAERSWQNNNIRCQATNTRLLSPHERSARIEMRLRPTSVKIINKPDRLLAEGEMVLICVIQGSRPPVDVTWFRENRQYTRGRHSETSNDTTTISKMVMRPQPDDDGAIIRCRAENRALNFGLEDFFRMTVIYKPVITLTLGSTLNPDDIKEGDDVYFECNIKANPKEYRISWYHNDELVTQNLSSGVFISTKSLVLQKVRKQNRGLYTCKAANLLGESSSLTVYLRVQFSPICAQPSPFLLGARIDEPLRVRCQVDADPSEVTFYWQFNNSGESFQVSPARYTIVDQPNKGGDNVDGLKSDDYTVAFASGGTVSELRYRAASDRDYGALHCRAGNSVGHQIKPCVIQLVPAARPTPPRNCSWHKVFKNEEKYLTVQCYAGYDGGLSQHFTIELLGKHARVLLNTSSRYQDYAARSMADLVVWLNMSWSVLDSLPDNAVVAVVARNIKGPSEPVILTNLIFRDPKPEETTYADLKFPIAVAMSILAAAIAASAAIVAIIVRRRNNQASGSKRPSQSVVQVDSQGRNFVIAYPPPPAVKEDKPDILIPKPEDRPRVVFETTSGSGRTSFFFKKTNRDGPPDDNKVSQPMHA